MANEEHVTTVPQRPSATVAKPDAAGGTRGHAVQLKQALRDQPLAVQTAMLAPAVQRAGGNDEAQVHQAASEGIASGGGALPHADKIQAAFGSYDVSHVKAHTGPSAAKANAAMGAQAYATGNHIAFGGSPDLHTTAHEAAHVVQQQAGVSLAGGVGKGGDKYEQHADRVADAVVAGRSAEGLLGEMGGGPSVQRREARSVQRQQGRYVQRQSLEQAGLTAGLTEDGTSAVVGAALTVKKYKVVVPQSEIQPGRTEALQKASEKNAELGGKLNAKVPSGKVIFTKDASNFDKSTIKETIDPFVLEVAVPFTKDGAQHTLTCEYQHARQFSGYVSKVTDTSNAAVPAEGGQMVAAARGAPMAAGTYGVDHHDAGSANVADTAGAGGGAENLDAYTKIAGEGSRWLCVRNHASKLQNDSWFFTSHATDPTKVWAVNFVSLYRQWDATFNKAFNIPDATVAAKLKSGVVVGGVAIDKSALAVKDYDLDTGAGFVAGAN